MPFRMVAVYLATTLPTTVKPALKMEMAALTVPIAVWDTISTALMLGATVVPRLVLPAQTRLLVRVV